MKRKLFAVFSILLSLNCVFDSEEEKNPVDIDAGTYEMQFDTLFVQVYPTGGAFINFYSIPGQDFEGDIELSFEGPSYIHGSFFIDKLEAEHPYSDIVMSIDSTEVRGFVDCMVLAKFAGVVDSTTIKVEIVEKPQIFGKDFFYELKDKFINWFNGSYLNMKLEDSDIVIGFKTVPFDLLGGNEWIFISSKWVLFINWGYGNYEWITLSMRGQTVSSYYVNDWGGKYVETEKTDQHAK